jgi:UDP-glucose 4-epimerase
MKYLVTGGAGFIGSHIVDALVADGQDVVVLDNLSSGHKENLSNVWNRITFINGDVRDAETCLNAAQGCAGIFHQAALVSVPDSVNRPRDNHEINITGTLNVLEAARANGVQRVVFAGSAAIYGDAPELPKREEMLPEPKSPYALAKLTGEHYLKVYAECFGLEAVALRYFNVFGPRQDPSSMYSGVISIFSERIAKGLPVTIYGDGQQTRDFVNVADVVQANLLAMQVDCRKSEDRGQTSDTPGSMPHAPCAQRFVALNVATGQQCSLLMLLDALGKICGVEPKVNLALSRPGDIRHSLADISKIRKHLGYHPEVTLKDGLAHLLGC